MFTFKLFKNIYLSPSWIHGGTCIDFMVNRKKTLSICVEKKATEFANTLNRKCDIQLEHIITEPHCIDSTPLELLVQSFKFNLLTYY